MGIDYKSAGVDKEAGYKTVSLIKKMVKETHSEEVLSELGGFSGLFDISSTGITNPVLVSGTDGVGTKVLLAKESNIHHTIGQDCVAMCVNDILCQGARPLFFLDYIGTGKIIPDKMADIVQGVATGCKLSGCSLIGGETAEMPGVYDEDEYDLAGFAVGIVDKERIITGSSIEAGDIIFALPSSGVHSNGFSLVRKILSDKKIDLNQNFEKQKSLAEVLLEPTRIYVPLILGLMERVNIKGMSHITGGGLYENIPRMLPEDLHTQLNLKEVIKPEIFNALEEWGNVDREEMYHTFNMGIGFVFVCSAEDEDMVVEYFSDQNEALYKIGQVKKGSGDLQLNY